MRHRTREPDQNSGSVALGERHLNPQYLLIVIASQPEGFSGSFTPKAMVKTASFAAVEAANDISGNGKHNDSGIVYCSLLSARHLSSCLPFRDPVDQQPEISIDRSHFL